MEVMAVDSIKDIINKTNLKESLVTGQQEPSRDSKPKDLRREETVTKTCPVCQKSFDVHFRYDRDGKRWNVNHELCAICRQNKKLDDTRKYLQEHLTEQIEMQREKWMNECQIPGFFIEKAGDGFDKFDSTLQPEAFKAVKSFNGKSLILSSPGIYGVGKTHLVCCLAQYLMDHTEAVSLTADCNYRKYKCPVLFITEHGLLSKIKNTYSNNYQTQPYAEKEEDVYDKLSAFHVLIIDDVGKVRPKDYSFLQGVYFRIIDERYTNEQVVILTTNLSPPELEEHIGGACADRLKEMCGNKNNIVRMAGKSYRNLDKG
jgi:DNA replication protein DnaC